MSFIFQDKNLLNQLLKLAQVADLGGDLSQIRNIAQKLVDNLVSQTSNNQEFTAEKSDVNLSTKHLTDLNSLLYFLQSNGISFGNMKLALSHASQAFSAGVSGDATFKSLPENIQSLYAKYPNSENFQYYVYKDGLLKYMQDLQAKAAENAPSGRIMRPYIVSLIKQIEQELEIKVPAHEQKQNINPAIKLDFLPDVLVSQSPYVDGKAILLSKNLSSKGELYNFLTSNNISIKNNDEVKHSNDFDGNDMCSIVQVLYLRAKRYADTKDDTSSKTYLQLLTNLASSMQCQIGAAPTQKAENANYKQVGYVSDQGQLTDHGVGYLTTNAELPLMDSDIDFDRIERFANAFRNIGIPRAAATSDYVLQVLTDIKRRYPLLRVQSLLATNYTELTKYISDSTAKGPNPETSAAPFISLLGQVLQAVEQMLNQLNAMLRTFSSPAVKEYQQDVQDQIENKYRKNIYALRTLQGQMENAFQALQQQNKRR